MKTTILGSMLVVGLLAAVATIGCGKGELVTDTAAACARQEQGNIVDMVANNPSFSILARAIDAADLTETLKGDGPFTVFAPTNEAFSKLPEDTLEQLLLPENKGQLRDLLLGHVVSGRINESQIQAMNAVVTLAGEQLPVEAKPDGIMIGASMVMGPEIEASNGVIHVIDAVILPESQVSPPEEVTMPPQSSAPPSQGAIGAPQEPAMSPEEPGIAPQEPVEMPAPPQQSTGCPSTNP